MENQGNNMNNYFGQRIFIRPNPITTLMGLLNNIDNIDDIITESMDNKEQKKPMCKEYLKKLNIKDISESDITEKISCAICQEEFKIGEKALELPCEGSSHFFHIKNDDECPGIYPWIDEKNSCPVCRAEFPFQEESETEQEPEPEPEHNSGHSGEVPNIPLPENINDIFSNIQSNMSNIIIQEPVRIINPRANILQNILGEAMDQAFQEIEDNELNEAIRRSLED